MAIHYKYGKTRIFGGLKFEMSVTANTKREATGHADHLRGKGVLVRVVKAKSGYELYTR